MKILRYILICFVALFSSCEFDHLHYETSLLALVRIDIDWSETELDPNGVSTFVYDSSGKLCKSMLSSDPDVVFLKLPAGKYTVVLHNNDISELNGLERLGMTKLSTSSIRATTRTGTTKFEVDEEPFRFVNEPKDVASYTLRNIEILQSDIQYHYYKPDLSDYEQEVTCEYKATPRQIVHNERVIIHIEGLDNAKGAPTAILRGMSGGYSFDREITTDEDVMEEFKVNARITKTDGTRGEIIYGDYNTFGMHQNNPGSQKYLLDVRFNLIDGTHKDYHVDVTDSIKTIVGKYKNTHIIELMFEPLPDIEIDPEEPDVEGEYDPSTDDWLDVEVVLPM